MINIVLFEPEIPQNSGNIIRLCANSGAELHLIHPLGFELDEKKLRRASLDYSEWASVKEYPSLSAYLDNKDPASVYAISTKGVKSYTTARFHRGDSLIFGPESRGLPESYLAEKGEEQVLRIPMKPNSRSINLSNSVAIVLYEALRQLDFSD